MEHRYHIVYNCKSTIKAGTSPPIYLNKQSSLYHIRKDQFLPKAQLPTQNQHLQNAFLRSDSCNYPWPGICRAPWSQQGRGEFRADQQLLHPLHNWWWSEFIPLSFFDFWLILFNHNRVASSVLRNARTARRSTLSQRKRMNTTLAAKTAPGSTGLGLVLYWPLELSLCACME